MYCNSCIPDLQKMHTCNLCDSCMGAMRFMHTDSSVMRLYESMRFVNRKSESSEKYLRIVVILPHYPKYPVNLYFCIIDIPFGIANLSVRIDSGKFVYATGISGSTPQWTYESPPQWKYESPPQWKLGFDSGDESVYPYSGN